MYVDGTNAYGKELTHFAIRQNDTIMSTLLKYDSTYKNDTVLLSIVMTVQYTIFIIFVCFVITKTILHKQPMPLTFSVDFVPFQAARFSPKPLNIEYLLLPIELKEQQQHWLLKLSKMKNKNIKELDR